MGKKTNITGYSVHVEGAVNQYIRNEQERLKDSLRTCDNIVAEIKRHVDGVETVFTKTHTETVCEHCGYDWGVKDGEANGCCEKDDAEHTDTPALLQGVCPIPPLPNPGSE